MTFPAACLLLAWVVTSLFANGIAAIHYFTRRRGLELLGYGAAAGVLLHGLVGLAIVAFPGARSIFTGLLIGVSLLSSAYFIRRGLFGEFSAALSRPIKLAFGIWLLFLVLLVGLLHLEVRFPEPLPDGPYVFKSHTTNVKVQYLTSLPADNYIAFAVSEFFLRGISFQEHRPIMPANEVSNRTILMSLVVLPFRVAMGAPRDQPELGTYTYVGREWPDVSKLDTDNSFEQFSIVCLVSNSLLLLGVIVFCSGLGASSIIPVAALLYVTNPYFIGQTVFTWPKALAAFFILLGWNSIRAGESPAVVAALLALAFHAHPYAIVFAGWVALFYLLRRQVKSGLLYLLVLAVVLAPWIIWTRWVLQIPSDLIAQNFSGPGTQEAWGSVVGFIWIRLHNLFYTLFSTVFTVYPFELRAVLDSWLFSLPGAVGLILIYPALRQCAEVPTPRSWFWFGFLGPALSILAVYSCPALPVLHGYQAFLGVLVFFGVWWLERHLSRPVFLSLIGFQLAWHLGTIVARAAITGVHF
jgi:hypothetical protein